MFLMTLCFAVGRFFISKLPEMYCTKKRICWQIRQGCAGNMGKSSVQVDWHLKDRLCEELLIHFHRHIEKLPECGEFLTFHTTELISNIEQRKRKRGRRVTLRVHLKVVFRTGRHMQLKHAARKEMIQMVCLCVCSGSARHFTYLISQKANDFKSHKVSSQIMACICNSI